MDVLLRKPKAEGFAVKFVFTNDTKRKTIISSKLQKIISLNTLALKWHQAGTERGRKWETEIRKMQKRKFFDRNVPRILKNDRRLDAGALEGTDYLEENVSRFVESCTRCH